MQGALDIRPFPFARALLNSFLLHVDSAGNKVIIVFTTTATRIVRVVATDPGVDETSADLLRSMGFVFERPQELEVNVTFIYPLLKDRWQCKSKVNHEKLGMQVKIKSRTRCVAHS